MSACGGDEGLELDGSAGCVGGVEAGGLQPGDGSPASAAVIIVDDLPAPPMSEAMRKVMLAWYEEYVAAQLRRR